MATFPSLKDSLEEAIAGTISREKAYDRDMARLRLPTERDYLLMAFKSLIEAYLSRVGGFQQPFEREWHGTQKTMATSN